MTVLQTHHVGKPTTSEALISLPELADLCGVRHQSLRAWLDKNIDDTIRPKYTLGNGIRGERYWDVFTASAIVKRYRDAR